MSILLRGGSSSSPAPSPPRRLPRGDTDRDTEREYDLWRSRRRTGLIERSRRPTRPCCTGGDLDLERDLSRESPREYERLRESRRCRRRGGGVGERVGDRPRRRGGGVGDRGRPPARRRGEGDLRGLTLRDRERERDREKEGDRRCIRMSTKAEVSMT